MSASNLDEAIQSLPPELREKICKELVSAKQKERSEMGWDEVHEDLLESYLSDSQDQIVADFNCDTCGIGCFKGYDPLCYLCKVTEVEMFFAHRERCAGCTSCISPIYLSNHIDVCAGCRWCISNTYLSNPLDEEID